MKHARSDYDRIQDPSGKIPDDEPVFILRGQDRAAPAAVRAWAAKAEELGADHAIVDLARRQAYDMEEWQERIAVKTPDLPKKG